MSKRTPARSSTKGLRSKGLVRPGRASASSSTTPSRKTPKGTTAATSQRSVSSPVKRKRGRPVKHTGASTPTARQAGANLMSQLGGRERVVELLNDSSHPKAQQLIERMHSSEYLSESFATSYSAVGMKAADIVEIFADVAHAKTFISAYQQADEVMQSLIRAAKDNIHTHRKCDGTGWEVDKRTGQPTDIECSPCHGSGYVIEDGSLQAQQLYFELIQWRKGPQSLVQINQQRTVNNNSTLQQNSQLNFLLTGQSPGEAPGILNILKRAEDQQAIPPSLLQRQLNPVIDVQPTTTQVLMPEEMLTND